MLRIGSMGILKSGGQSTICYFLCILLQGRNGRDTLRVHGEGTYSNSKHHKVPSYSLRCHMYIVIPRPTFVILGVLLQFAGLYL